MTNILETPAKPTARPESGKREPAPVRPSIVVVEDHDALVEHLSAWDDLARHALEPNPFYESWMVLPALRKLDETNPFFFVFVYLENTPDTKLCGFFPFQKSRFKRLPVAVLNLWTHAHCYLSTPLLRTSHAREALAALLDWARDDPRGAPLLEFDNITGEGPFYRLFSELTYERKTTCYLKECFTRAFWQASASADSYLNEAISNSGRQDFRRKRKRLGELGKLESKTLTASHELEAWLAQFLELEASGWKGESGTALNGDPRQRDYFLDIARSAFGRGQLQLLGLFLDDKAIALKCNFRSGDGAFFYKPAYDESYSRFSPGALLELDNIHLCHQEPQVRWMDYCTAPNNPLANRICVLRRPIQSWMLSSGRAPGDLLVSLRPLMHWLGRRLKRTR